MRYKEILGGFDMTKVTCILRIDDGAIIPLDTGNLDYQKYLEWVAEGNTPEPADE